MQRIATASSLLIEVQPEGWRLLLNGTGDRTLLEARRGEPIRYAEIFGTRRKLPLAGELEIDYVDRVVLGWSAKDEAWHLGLVLRPPVSEERGSRWCELAHWIDPGRDQFQAAAVAVGEALGAEIDRPFVFIPPALPEPPPLPALPLRFDLWTLRDGEGYELTRAGKWARSQFTRALWYLLWSAAFFVLALTSVTSGIAYPTPHLLVPAGFACAFGLLIAAIGLLVRVLLRPNRIVIDGDGVRWMRGGATTKHIPLDDIAAVYVSHIVGARDQRKIRPSVDQVVAAEAVKKGMVYYGELNLDTRGEKFERLVAHGGLEERITVTEPVAAVVPLTQHLYQTPLQAAALLLAARLRVPVYYDQRAR